ncbi:MAG: hypothetical protein RIS34_1756 [Pseudomonadota bacterium]
MYFWEIYPNLFVKICACVKTKINRDLYRQHTMTKAAQPVELVAPQTTGLPEPALAEQAVALVLQPIARLMIDHGMQLPSMVEMLKNALVQEAAGTYSLLDKGSSDTRIALLTGVHRKDVKRLRETPNPSNTAPPMVSVAASVVARWISEPRFLNADQSTRPLARTPGRSLPGEPDFTSLVAEVSSDVGARAVLDELDRLGVVQLQNDGYVVLKAAAYVPQEGLRESFHFLATNVSDHLSTAVHNLAPTRRGPRMLEQSAFSQDLSAAQAEQLQQLARRLWSGILQQFLQTATVSEQRSQGDQGPRRSVRFGVYFHEATQGGTVTAGKTAVAGVAKTRKKKSS